MDREIKDLPGFNQLDKESLKQCSSNKNKPNKTFYISCGDENDSK